MKEKIEHNESTLRHLRGVILLVVGLVIGIAFGNGIGCDKAQNATTITAADIIISLLYDLQTEPTYSELQRGYSRTLTQMYFDSRSSDPELLKRIDRTAANVPILAEEIQAFEARIANQKVQ